MIRGWFVKKKDLKRFFKDILYLPCQIREAICPPRITNTAVGSFT